MDVARRKLTALDYQFSERSTSATVAEIRDAYRRGDERVRRHITKPGRLTRGFHG
ncbi:hypothetical protein B0G38_004534 [Arthrobacter sp. VKM Ac-2550]|nr:hypothetical protein [Arthrobacter sp. VKM Ac-2550]